MRSLYLFLMILTGGIDGQYQVSRDAKLLNDKGVMTRLVKVDWQVLTVNLHTVPAVHDLFTCHRLEWVARHVGSYNKDIVREFYASYVATL